MRGDGCGGPAGADGDGVRQAPPRTVAVEPPSRQATPGGLWESAGVGPIPAELPSRRQCGSRAGREAAGGQALDDLAAGHQEQRLRRGEHLGAAAAGTEDDRRAFHDPGVDPQRQPVRQAEGGDPAEHHAGQRPGLVGRGERRLLHAEALADGAVHVQAGRGQHDAGRVARRFDLADDHDRVGRVLEGVAVGLRRTRRCRPGRGRRAPARRWRPGR